MKEYINLSFTQDDLKLINGCLLTTKEFFKSLPYKNQDIKNKIKQIDILLLKFTEGSK